MKNKDVQTGVVGRTDYDSNTAITGVMLQLVDYPLPAAAENVGSDPYNTIASVKVTSWPFKTRR